MTIIQDLRMGTHVEKFHKIDLLHHNIFSTERMVFLILLGVLLLPSVLLPGNYRKGTKIKLNSYFYYYFNYKYEIISIYI